MTNSLKKLSGPLLFGLIQIFTFVRYKPQNMEVFFMFWAFMSLSLLIYTWFNLPSRHDYYWTAWSARGVKSYVESSGYLIYVFYLLMNVAGYIGVMK